MKTLELSCMKYGALAVIPSCLNKCIHYIVFDTK